MTSRDFGGGISVVVVVVERQVVRVGVGVCVCEEYEVVWLSKPLTNQTR